MNYVREDDSYSCLFVNIGTIFSKPISSGQRKDLIQSVLKFSRGLEMFSPPTYNP